MKGKRKKEGNNTDRQTDRQTDSTRQHHECTHLGVVVLVLEMRGDEADGLNGLVSLGRHAEAGRLGPSASGILLRPRVARRVRMHPAVGWVHLGEFDVGARVRRVLLPYLLHSVGGWDRASAVGYSAVRFLRPPVVVVRPAHEEQLRQVVEEDDTHPARHPVRARRPEVPVDDDDGDEDREDVHDEREQEVLCDERDADGRRRQDLGDQQQEDDQGEQDRYTHRHLLTGVGGKVKHRHAEEGDENARDDQIDRVEQRLATNLQRERHLLLDMSVDAIRRVLQLAGTVDDVPRTAVDIVAQVDPFLLLVERQADLVAVKRPRAELHLALLLVEGEVFDVDTTRALVDGGRDPQHVAVVADNHRRLVGHLVAAVSTATGTAGLGQGHGTSSVFRR